MDPTPRIPRLRLRIKPAAEAVIRGGHPWVWADSVRDPNRPGEAGELAVVYDRQDRFLALGLYDPDSPLRVRLLHTGKPVQVDAAWWRQRLEAAVDRRRDAVGPDTDGYRIVNGESDGWPGLVLDRYADTLVLKLYTPAWLGAVAAPGGVERLPGLRLPELIHAVLRPARIVLRLSRNLEVAAAVAGLSNGMTSAGMADGGRFRGGEDLPAVVFRETGLRFEADTQRGQKTGFFLDQRENRRKVGGLSAGAEVLNAFSFSGGFSLYAARGGARSVVDLDLSPHALASARRNFALNQDLPPVTAARHEQVQADCFEWLARGPARTFDVVVCDPPSLAKREHERAGAIQAYGRLAADSLRRVRPGGWLVAASCSAHVSAEEFHGAVRQAVRAAGRRAHEVETTGHAPDHRATFPEAQYLKAIYFRLAG